MAYPNQQQQSRGGYQNGGRPQFQPQPSAPRAPSRNEMIPLHVALGLEKPGPSHEGIFVRNLGRGADVQWYMDVKYRLLWLRRAHPEAEIETELMAGGVREEFALFRCRIVIPDAGSATGWGHETAGDFGDFIEKAETKAEGRALAALGFGIQFVDRNDGFDLEQDGAEAGHEYPGDTAAVPAATLTPAAPAPAVPAQEKAAPAAATAPETTVAATKDVQADTEARREQIAAGAGPTASHVSVTVIRDGETVAEAGPPPDEQIKPAPAPKATATPAASGSRSQAAAAKSAGRRGKSSPAPTPAPIAAGPIEVTTLAVPDEIQTLTPETVKELVISEGGQLGAERVKPLIYAFSTAQREVKVTSHLQPDELRKVLAAIRLLAAKPQAA